MKVALLILIRITAWYCSYLFHQNAGRELSVVSVGIVFFLSPYLPFSCIFFFLFLSQQTLLRAAGDCFLVTHPPHRAPCLFLMDTNDTKSVLDV